MKVFYLLVILGILSACSQEKLEPEELNVTYTHQKSGDLGNLGVSKVYPNPFGNQLYLDLAMGVDKIVINHEKGNMKTIYPDHQRLSISFENCLDYGMFYVEFIGANSVQRIKVWRPEYEVE